MQTQGVSPRAAPEPGSVPVFVLCGGSGTRLLPVETRPKAVCDVAGRPFLFYTLRLLRLQGFRRFVLLLGVGAEQVRAVFSGPKFSGGDHFGDGLSGPEFEYSEESEPLGTGGALGLARERSAGVNLVVNGDSYAEVLYQELLRVHFDGSADPDTTLTLLALSMDSCAGYGSLEINPEGTVTAFREKENSGPGWINAGVYAVGGGVFRDLPPGKSSLEVDLLPALARAGRLRAQRRRFFFRDIGTPERLALAREEFQWIRNRMAAEEAGPGPRPRRNQS
jgi:NDP-sugar pyrophosphorylase family protein